MSPKKQFIRELALHLANTGTIMSGPELADHLNRNGHKTDYGTEYTGGRGTYTLVQATYNECYNNGDIVGADAIAKSFVKEDGTYAYL